MVEVGARFWRRNETEAVDVVEKMYADQTRGEEKPNKKWFEFVESDRTETTEVCEEDVNEAGLRL